ncbi:MAG: UDP-N-acetylmuramate dehydrogenase [Candidatus Wallbacteria bacterium]|nr:UDP-N-acetylmuramate dehydrogenase [Candidatus Wallbacteria bacterium]
MKVYQNYPVAQLTTFGLGGNAEKVVFPESPEELAACVEKLSRSGENYFLLGNGSNLIFQDCRIEGTLVVNRSPGLISEEDDCIRADSSVSLSNLLEFCLGNGIGGYEFLSGIPGTVGGAVSGNAGAYGDSIGNFVRTAELYSPEKGIFQAGQGDFNFDYRESEVKRKKLVITRVALSKPSRSSSWCIKSRTGEILAQRDSKLPPRGTPCAGSFFKNVLLPGADRRTAAAWFIDQAGCKGLRVGGIEVSPYHANFIVNKGNSSFSELQELVQIVKERVRDKFRIELQEEVIYYPQLR